jgi:excisionase family DNA binding protein
MASELITTKDAAKIAGVSQPTIRSWIKSGKIFATTRPGRSGDEYLIYRESLEALVGDGTVIRALGGFEPREDTIVVFDEESGRLFVSTDILDCKMVKRLAWELRCSEVSATGYVVMLWTWAAENARCGDISEYYADDIAAAVGYYGDKSSDLMSALLKSGVISHGDGWTGAFIRGWETIASA